MSWDKYLLLAVFLGTSAALAQSGGSFNTGQILTAPQLNSAFSAKQDYPIPDASALPTPFTSGRVSGNTSTFVTTTGSLTNTHCVQIDANGNFIDAGAACVGSGLTALTGDVAATGPGSATATIQAGAVTGTKIASGTIAGSNFPSQSAHTFFAGPTSGVAIPPSWRALITSDLPAPFTSGTASGNTTTFVTTTGSLTSTHCVQIDINGNFIDAGAACGGGGGGGSGITALTGDVAATGPGSATATIQSGVVTTGKIATGTILGTNFPNQSAHTVFSGPTSGTAAPTWRTLITSDLPAPFTSGTASGNTTTFATTTGALTNTHCVQIDANGNFIDAGAACGGGGGGITALTGDVAATGPGSSVATIQAGAVTSSKIASGTIAGSNFPNQNAHTFFSGPTSGSAATPTWRLMLTSDLPSPFTSGTASGNTSTFATTTGALTNTHCVQIDANGNFIDAGGQCAAAGITALTGDVAATGPGSATATIQSGVVTGSKIASATVANSNLVSMAANTVKCRSATSSGAPQDCIYPVIYVTDPSYGAKCDGSTDDASAINNAISALPASGGKVMFPSGTTCFISSASISIGNGTSAAGSTRRGVVLGCEGNSSNLPLLHGFSTSSGCRILWGGASNATVININGPLQGWGLENIIIDCGSISGAIGLAINSAQQGLTHNLTVNNCLAGGIYSTTYATFGSFSNTDSLRNTFENTSVYFPATVATNAFGIKLTGANMASPGTDSDLDEFINTIVSVTGPTSNIVYAVWLQNADTNRFHNLTVTSLGGTANLVCVTFDYTGSVGNVWPSANIFDGIDCATAQIFNTGTPGSGAKPNYFIGVAEGNGTACPVLTNLACYGSHSLVYAPGGNNASTDVWAAWVPYTLSPSCGTGTFSNVTSTSNTSGKTTYVKFRLVLATQGTCSGLNLNINLPNTVAVAGALTGMEYENTGLTVVCATNAATSTMACVKQTGATPNLWQGGDDVVVSGVYENQ